MSWYSHGTEPAEPSNRIHSLRRNRERNLDGTGRNRGWRAPLNTADWFRSVPLEFRCVVPL
jgi:hypothetical protein